MDEQKSAKAESFLADEGPVTTSKALMVQIVAPRKFKTKPTATSVEADDDKTARESTSDSVSTSTTCAKSERQPLQSKLTTVSDKSERQPLQTKKSSLTADSPDSTTENRAEDKRAKATVTEKFKLNNDGEEESKEQDDITSSRTEDSQEVTPEEAAAVQVHVDDPEDAIVNVEELLRICFHNLALDAHLLNVPTYTMVRHLTKIIAKDSGDAETERERSIRDLFRNEIAPVDDEFEWVQVKVMARPTSLCIILDRLERIGVGTNCGTVTVFKAEFCRTASPYAHIPVVESESDTDVVNNSDEGNAGKIPALSEQKSGVDVAKQREIEAAKAEWKNAATRLRIEQVREQIIEQAALSFDFIALLSIASILAGVGLITDNTVVIVASMLVSPIMGPCLGLTFGSRIRDWPLVKSSFLHETLALTGCVVIGALVGIGAGFTDLAEETWPTNEMQIRGEASGLLTGIAIAIPSGMGVCLSILGGNTSSLVGVAISASLLPPAVNAGVCLMYAIVLKAGSVVSDSGKDANDFAVIGGISFALTVVNIFCIWLSGMVMFEIKEVAPRVEKSAFWAKDIKVARELNKGKKAERPPPVDLSVIKQGVKTALDHNRTDSEPPVETIKFQPPSSHRNTIGGRKPETLEAALALHPRQRPTHRYDGSFWASNEDLEQIDDNVRYVGLEDMAKLLGFDEEDGDDEAVHIDHSAVGRHLGRGRYL